MNIENEAKAAPDGEAAAPPTPSPNSPAKGRVTRRLAARVVRETMQQRVPLDEALELALEAAHGLDARDRGFLHEVAVGTIRWLPHLDRLLLAAMDHPLSERRGYAWAVLRTALYQARQMRVPARAAVFEAVELMRASPEKDLVGFVNAVLRRSVEAPDPEPPAGLDEAARLAFLHAHPEWMARRWVEAAGAETARRRMEAGNALPPLTLRVNGLKQRRDDLLALFAAAGVEARPCLRSPDGIQLTRGGAIPLLPGYVEGWFAVQDEGAQLIAPMLRPRPGESILDACAAPGGKSAHLAALTGGKAHLTAVDPDSFRLKRMADNFARLGVSGVTLVPGDAGSPEWLPGRMFDKALVDAPCSGTGVIRRHPDIKWHRDAAGLVKAAEGQRRILDNVARRVRPGGVMVYAVCSLETEEGGDQVRRFLAEHPDWALSPLDGEASLEGLLTDEGMMRIEPEPGGMDGFFAARLVRPGNGLL
ncbi:MAG: 16S rRNA (cytosine(967)-C(5))-methyltransferase RsmB [Magnetococcales bacterium]|nr:16S rRNA (cytosine(967)-C(5))-methyltransferase RsmB [Magnetococcales bacterium]